MISLSFFSLLIKKLSCLLSPNSSFLSFFKFHITEMFLRVIYIVFLFLVRLGFPSHMSTVQVIRNRYGNEVGKLMRKFERLDFKYRKVLLDLDFPDNCIRNNVVPKFVQFRVPNKDLRNSPTYRQCQTKLLKQEISNKKRRARLLKMDLQSARNDLMCKLKWIDFNDVYNLFLLGNDKALRKHQKIQNKKFDKLSEVSCESVSHDPDKVIYNFSSHKLIERKNLFYPKAFSLR